MSNRIACVVMFVVGIVNGTSAFAQNVTPIGGSEKQKITALDMTAGRLFDESDKQVKRIGSTVEAHKKLLEDANRTGLVVAIEAIGKDVNASRQLFELASDLLGELQKALALNVPDNANLKIKDPLDYSQVKEIRILGDQADDLYRSDKKFLESLQKPTELKVTREDNKESKQ